MMIMTMKRMRFWFSGANDELHNPSRFGSIKRGQDHRSVREGLRYERETDRGKGLDAWSCNTMECSSKRQDCQEGER